MISDQSHNNYNNIIFDDINLSNYKSNYNKENFIISDNKNNFIENTKLYNNLNLQMSEYIDKYVIPVPLYTSINKQTNDKSVSDKSNNYKSNDKSNDKSISDDHSLTNNIGYSFIISDKLLGHGSYGDVYLATDEHNKKVAVKCCNLDANGIPNILETSIMASFIHPYLNRALRIQASSNKLYIIQDLAVTDLAQHTRKDKGNNRPSYEQLRMWSFSLCQAVAALHNDNIIHADIKANNVLLYKNGSIRLTDFTLATKKWISDDTFTHNVCTCTHRPLECLLQREWNESLDIWSLGCTLYEIAYGQLLFNYQGALEPDHKVKNKEAKIRLRQRSINVILDWSRRGPIQTTPDSLIDFIIPSIEYIPFSLHEDFNDPNMSLFNDMICKMLSVDPTKRPTINQILSFPYFDSLSQPSYLFIKRPLNKLPIAEQARVTRHIQRATDNSIVQSLALSLYCRCNNLSINETLKSATCTWIASKLVTGVLPKFKLKTSQLLMAEREICHNLSFRLHST